MALSGGEGVGYMTLAGVVLSHSCIIQGKGLEDCVKKVQQRFSCLQRIKDSTWLSHLPL